MKCPYCGADVFSTDETCQHCGSAVTRDLPPVASETDGDVFERIKRSPAYAERDSPERLARVPKIGPTALVFPIVFFIFFIGFGGFMAVMALAMSGLMVGFGGRAAGVGMVPALMSLVPIGFVVLGVFMMRGAIKKYRRISQAPIESQAAVVAGKRTAVSGGGRNSSASTSYYATFEFEDGTRTEFGVQEDLYSQLAERDAGILFHRAEYAADFERVNL